MFALALGSQVGLRGCPRLRWRTMACVLVLVLFPRVVALLTALLVRLVVRALWGLLVHFVKELYLQATLGAAELEDQLVFWLHQQLGWQATPSPAPQQTMFVAAAEPAPVPPPPPSQPTRPIDLIMVLLLGLTLRRMPVGGVGEVRQ